MPKPKAKASMPEQVILEADRQMQAGIQRALETWGMTMERWAGELVQIATVDAQDYFDIGEGGGVTVKPFARMPKGASKAIKKIKERRVIRSGEGNDALVDSHMEIELHDKLAALSKIGEATGWSKQQMEVKDDRFTALLREVRAERGK